MNDKLTELVENYKPSANTIELVRSTPIVLLVGISGAGKDTIKHRLLQGGTYHHIVSHTTRAPRKNSGIMEQDGVDYHFITREQAIGMLERGEFIEAKQYSGNMYGTSAVELRAAAAESKIALTDIEVQGVAEYMAISNDVIAEFILPPNYDEWQKRLHSRYEAGALNSEDMAKRMRRAIEELREALSKPYYHFIVNDNLDEAVNAVNRIAQRHGEFDRVDRSYQIWAERLLEQLESHEL